MPELIITRARIFTCLSTPGALDQLHSAARTAPDEALLVTAPEDGDAAKAEAIRTLEATDPAALVVETTDGWEGLTLDGEGSRELFAHLSELHLPSEGFIQGDVGRLPAKVFASANRITLFTPSPQVEYLRQRIIALGANERPGPEIWTAR